MLEETKRNENNVLERGVPDAYYPHEARIRNLTYQIDSKVDVHIEKR